MWLSVCLFPDLCIVCAHVPVSQLPQHISSVCEYSNHAPINMLSLPALESSVPMSLTCFDMLNSTLRFLETALF